MNFIHIKNLEKYHPGYKDRRLRWAKIYFDMIQGDPEVEMLHEIDRGRLITFILLELQAQKPVPLNETYLERKGFDLKVRSISLTLDMLHNFTEVVTQDEKLCGLEQEKEKSKSKNKNKNKSKIDVTESNIPSYDEFLNYCKTLDSYHHSFNSQIEAKFQSWVENKWRDGFDKPIKNWKTKIQNTMPYFKKDFSKSKDAVQARSGTGICCFCGEKTTSVFERVSACNFDHYLKGKK